MAKQKNNKKGREVELVATKRVFEGLSKQNMLFHQCIFELVDNAVAAAKDNVKINVQVAFEPIEGEEDSFYLYVIDNGIGMNEDVLCESLQLGHKPISNSRLNEHGFGLKNSLATLSGGNGEWTLWTRDGDKGEILRVDGPFAPKMMVYNEGNKYPDKPFIDSDITTVIKTKVKRSFAQTVQGRGARAKDLNVFRMYLIEHLGVAYRGYLSLDKETNDTKAIITVSVGSDRKTVSAINVPMGSKQTEHIEVELGGKTYELTYSWGTLDEVERDKLVKGERAKYYYQKNMATQGIDIQLGDRVIATRQLEHIWRAGEGKPLSRDNHFNSFVGELVMPELPRGVLTTINNKTDFNLDDPGWMKIFDRLNEQEFRPIKDGKSTSESELRDQWKSMLKATNPNDDISTERYVWGNGVRIDVYQKKSEPDGSTIIYELKVGSAAPLNLYQLKMYWDGLLMEDEQPSQAVLMVEKYDDKIESMASSMNKMTPPNLKNGKKSKAYNFVVVRHKDKGLLKDNK